MEDEGVVYDALGVRQRDGHGYHQRVLADRLFTSPAISYESPGRTDRTERMQGSWGIVGLLYGDDPVDNVILLYPGQLGVVALPAVQCRAVRAGLAVFACTHG